MFKNKTRLQDAHCSNKANTGADPVFPNVSALHITTAKSFMARINVPHEGHGSSRIVYALSCYLSLTFEAFDTKLD